MKTFTLIIVFSIIFANGISQSGDEIKLWPGEVPGEPAKKEVPVIASLRERNITRITEVTDPAIVFFPASDNNKTGMSVIVCPGGGYNILAIDLEGYEIASWLNTLGISAFVLQYRVPKKQDGALQDVQRAIRIVRGRVAEWKLDPEKIGVMGFSAGGSLSARASTRFNEKTYMAVDEYDSLSCRPDFAVLIYPAYLDNGPGKSLTPELTINEKTPPIYIFGTADDTYGNSCLVMVTALRNAKVPVELHFMPIGGHGYGLRPGNIAAETWPGLLDKWFLRNVMK
jgi:acetyl esterase/lipase